MVPQDVRSKVDARKAEIVAGTYKVFSGPVKEQNGAVRVPEGQVLSDQDMLGMTWFVEGVVGSTQ